MSDTPQSFEKHAKMVPGYHYVLFSLLLWGMVQEPSWGSLIGIVFMVAFVMTALYARLFALGVQDRVIRLEERLRMAEVLPEDLRSRIGEITTEQIIGLRFAPDEELPDLVRRVLDEGIADRKTIKQAVKNWRADHQRI
jgi:uncharacterized membrane protein YciS (DUF1049 family)